MKTLGRIFGVLSILGMLLAFIPLLGWLNWFIIPLAVIGLLFSLGGKSKGGTVLCVVAILFGIVRLVLGGGIL